MIYTLETVCKELRLNSLPSLVDDPKQEEWLLKLLINEVEAKEERKNQRLIKQAKFIKHLIPSSGIKIFGHKIPKLEKY